MEDEDYDPPPTTPFWLRSDSNNTYFRRSSSLGGRAAAVASQVVFLAAAVFLLFFFVIPPFVSTASQIFRPHLVRRSWDYLNFVLVLFAIICGFLSRNTDNSENRNDQSITNSYEYGYSKYSRSSSFDRGRISTSVTPRHWYDDRRGGRYSDQIVYNRFGRLRSSSSYPDLRLRESDEDERWRFYDDTRLYGYRIDGPDRVYESYSSWREAQPAEMENRSPGGGGYGDGKKTEVDDAAMAEPQELDDSIKQLPQSSQPSAPPSPPPAPSSPPPSKPARRKKKRVYRDVAPKADRRQRDDAVGEASEPPQPPPQAPPPPPPPPIADAKSKKNEKKRAGTTKDFLIALRRKKKKQRQKSVDGLDLLFGSDPPSADSRPPQSPPHPPPPPPLPPPPFLHGLFSSKKGKSKRSHSTPPPPPPPPHPLAHQRPLESRASTVNTRRAPLESRASKPNPPAAKSTAFNGNESPLLPIPPPPPPPPFKMPVWKFVVQGDYVRMASDLSSRSESQDLDDSEDPERVQSDDGETPGRTDGDSPAGRLFCPSPDVDTKADNFIARFRAGLRLEKMNSVNQRRGRSNLGPETEPEPGSEAEANSQPCIVQDGASGQ